MPAVDAGFVRESTAVNIYQSVLLSLDHSKECREVKKFLLCLKFYLAAMQLFPAESLRH